MSKDVLPGIHLAYDTESAGDLLKVGDVLPPAERVTFVQSFRIAQSNAQRAIEQRDELMRKARRVAMTKADEAEAAAVVASVKKTFGGLEERVRALLTENAQLRGALASATKTVQKVGSDAADLRTAVTGGFAELRKAVAELGKQAAVPTSLRTIAASADPHADERAVLEKALASATHAETVVFLKTQIAQLKK